MFLSLISAFSLDNNTANFFLVTLLFTISIAAQKRHRHRWRGLAGYQLSDTVSNTNSYQTLTVIKH
jgi:hypothetical protein